MGRGYELIRRIAGGGMGEVFVARLTGAGDFEKRVALKLLLPHLASSPDLVRRFHDEARLAARMHHPNIVEIFDVGEADGRPFIAMQFVDGLTLSRLEREVWKKGERLPLPLVRFIAAGLCEALTYAHGLTDGQGRALRVVHRDVTPGNVLVSRNGAVLLTDFGIARVHDGSLTEPGALIGKAAYLAPEQVLYDAPVDARADIYSAGLTLYEALTGANPYKRATAKEALAAVTKGALEPAQQLRDDVSPGMAAALSRALARRPEDRFGAARQLREAFVDGPVATAPELAEYVRRFSVDSDAVPLELSDASGPGTRSLLSVTPTQLELPAAALVLPPPARSAPLVAGVALVLLALAGAAWWVLSAEGPPPVEVVVAQPLPVPPEPQPEPAPASAPEVVKVDVVAPAPPVASRPAQRKVAKPVSPPALRVGYLTADAAPWAEVLVDGRVIERTPFVRYPLPAGRYTLVFRGPGGETRERAVSLSEGKVTAVRVEF